MITFTSAQLDAWMAALFYPLTRILALFAAAPVFGGAGVPANIRLLLGLAVTIGLLPALPAMPEVPPASGMGLWIIAQQILIGLAMGYAMRIVFVAMDAAGELIGLQMGLGFATFYDPLNTARTPVVAEFTGLLATLVFLALNGHLLMIATVAESFSAFPVSAQPLGAGTWLNLVEFGSRLFSGGLLLSLPVVVTLLITNLALGILNRAAPQLNLFAVGFPLTLAVGFVTLALSLSYLAGPLQQLFEEGMRAMLGLVVRP